MNKSRITTNNETDFIETLYKALVQNEYKLLLGHSHGNGAFKPTHEIRCLATAGGKQFGMATIDCINRRGSGRYTIDIEEVYLRAIDYEKESKTAEWWLVPDSEHTVNSEYPDRVDVVIPKH